MFENIKNFFKEELPNIEFCSLRFVSTDSDYICIRQGNLEPIMQMHDSGYMITIIHNGSMGYAASSDVSRNGLKTTIARALEWANYSKGKMILDYSGMKTAHPKGEFVSLVKQSFDELTLKSKIELLQQVCSGLKISEEIVDWSSSLWLKEITSHYITNKGGDVYQKVNLVVPEMRVTAYNNEDVVSRSTGARGGKQGGLEILDEIGFYTSAPLIAEEALELLHSPLCPSGVMDLVLDSDQMILQIHESVGHPLEIDRILGDERNYAGTTFVKPEMIGNYKYGSNMMNITFDPSVEGQFASYLFDDDGEKAEKKYIIKDGVLIRALGSITSQYRSGISGVANSRASNWNRQPIDRMANLNLESGDASFDELIKSVESGVYMKTNTSWSIDDSRNKFQFGCEWARVIKDGELKGIVKKPNYRGISASFWRNLKMVGDETTREIMGTPYCGKGEPNQVIWVGHASPACLFSDVDVFGGE